jgi:hypothetical protein
MTPSSARQPRTFASVPAIALAVVVLACLLVPVASAAIFPRERMGIGNERTTGGGIIAGTRFTPRSAVVVWKRKWSSLTLYLLAQKGVTCAKLKHEAGRPGRLIQVSIPSAPRVNVNKPTIAQAVFIQIPRDPTKPQQASGLKNGPKVTFTRVDTYPGGMWHGRFEVPHLAYGDGRVYAYKGTFAARWCDFRN